jgi:hypothetical protein
MINALAQVYIVAPFSLIKVCRVLALELAISHYFTRVLDWPVELETLAGQTGHGQGKEASTPCPSLNPSLTKEGCPGRDLVTLTKLL